MTNGNTDYQGRPKEESDVLAILKDGKCPWCDARIVSWSELRIAWNCENGACGWTMFVSPVTLHKAGL